MKKLARLGAPALAATALLATTMAPASAATTTKYDASGDVTVCSASGDCRIVSSRTESDMTKVVTEHTSDRVVVRTSFRELGSFGSDTRQLVTNLGTNEGQHYTLATVWKPNKTTVHKEFWMSGTHEGIPLECAPIYARIESGANRIVVSIPRSCLSDPSWVKATTEYTRTASNGVTVQDQAFTTSSQMLASANREPLPQPYGPTTYKG